MSFLTDVVPAFEAKMLLFDSNYRPGRPKPLTPWQKAFKAMWLKLAARPLGTRAYKLDLLAFTCSCGQQKYNPFLLCKHLVQAFYLPDPAFFREIIRRRVTPFYRHSLLKPRDGSVLDCSMGDGSISDGDDFGNTTELPQSPTVQVRGVKRKRDDSGETAAGSGSATGPTLASPILISSSPIRDDEEYEDHDSVREFIRQRINELREGANILEGQLKNSEASKIWLKSMKNHNIGGDVSKMVSDIRHFTQTGRVRPTTWAQEGNKKSVRYTQNTMGFTPKQSDSMDSDI
ncbi:hypothetical protein B0H13DRAFT_2305533 [Mycena leptocephala]|nr:hypothetical protein B0H13DRAFT_2305533 [Mycena leptocephala]